MGRQPPRWAEWLLARCLPEAEREAVLGDLAQMYDERVARGVSAGIWYLRVAAALGLRFAGERVLEAVRPHGAAEGYSMRRAGGMTAWIRDLRTSIRALARRPGYSLIAVGTLALGIGATTAIFSVLYSSVLRPLPYPEPDQLVWMSDARIGGWSGNSQSAPNALDIQDRATRLASMAVYQRVSRNAFVGDYSERFRVIRSTPEFLPTLGLPLALGRSFTAEENLAGSSPVVVLSHETWQSRYGGDPGVLGEILLLDAEPHTVIGVAHRDLDLWSDPQLFVPMRWDPASLNRGNRGVQSIGRLVAGATLDGLNAELDAIMANLREDYPGPNDGWSAAAVSLEESLVGSAARRQLYLLIGAAALVLLIACVNVANLLLARAEVRSREISVRAALGAGRSRLVALFLSESLLLAALGGALGIVAAWVGLPFLTRLFGSGLPGADEASLAGPVLLLALAVTTLSGLAVGFIPAARIRLRHLGEGLRDGGRGATEGSSRLRRGLVVLQISMAVTLVLAAGLLLRSFWAVAGIDVGLSAPHSVVTFQLQLPGASYPDGAAVRGVATSLTERIGALPGVHSVGVSNRLPLNGGTNVTEARAAENPDRTAGFVELRSVTPGFFDAVGMQVVRGRGIEAADLGSEAYVTVITEELARQLWPDEDALGRAVRVWDGFEPTVVGVVANTRDMGPTRAPPPSVYFPVGGPFQPSNLILFVRSSGNPLDLVALLRDEVSQMDPNLAVYGVRTLDDVISQAAGRRRQTSMTLVLLFGVFALVLGAVGIYGVMSFQVTQRTREMGVRIALGARQGEVSWMVLGQGIRLTALGLILGVLGSYFSSRLLESLLYGVEAVDPATHLAVAVLLAAVALGASWLPARRAARIDPVEAFKEG